MRAFPTRRDCIFILAVVTVVTLFLHFGLGSLKAPQYSGLTWSKGVFPWGGGPESQPLAGDLKISLDAAAIVKESTVTWRNGKMPTTEIRVHVPGWTIFDKLYLFNGTVFVVTDEPKIFPDRMLLTSSGYPVLNDPDDVAKRTPTDSDMQIISSAQASELFGSYASRMDGTSFIINDSPQFISHYYHWAAEVFFGLWRAYSTLDPGITSNGRTILPLPRRIIMSHVPVEKWRDYAAMNQYVTRGAFPSISMEYQEDWADRASMAHPFLLERVVLADRAAAVHSPTDWLQRSNSGLFRLTASPHWWSTVRNNLIEFAGGDAQAYGDKVITYISRQEWGRRMLVSKDHDRLVKALEKLRDQHGYEVHIVSMDKLSRQEQIRLAGRTTILMGVHGNGLTSLLWMKPSRRATVMEFFYPGGFAYDYEWTTRALGMRHYGFWGNEYFTSPDTPPINYPEGFQGNEIPIDGDLVAQLCHERLSLPEG